MRIAILCPSFGEYAGIGRIAQALGKEFAGFGEDLALICRPEAVVSGLWTTVPRLELPLHQLPRRWRHLDRQTRFAADLVGAGFRLRRFLTAVRADLLLTLSISTFSPLAIVASRMLPVVVGLQGGEPDGRFAAHPRLFRRLLRGARGVAACARSLAQQAEALEPTITDRLAVIPNGVDPEGFTGVTPHTHERPYVLAAGRLTRQKGFDVLLDAIALSAPFRRGEVDLLIAGDGQEHAALDEQARRCQVRARVRFVGPVEAQDLARLYRGATVVAVPSRWEGLPLVCLEAMASGRPVVASRVDGIPDAVVDGETGILVPPDEPPALAAALDALLLDRARAERLGTAGCVRARRDFAWPTVARRYLTLLRAATHAG